MKLLRSLAVSSALLLIFLFSGSEARAEDSYKVWTPGPTMVISMRSDEMKVKPRQVLTMSVSALDWDHWNSYMHGQSEGAISGGNYIDGGLEDDKCFFTWTKSGGEWLKGSSETLRIWEAPKKGGEYTVTVSVDDLGLTEDLGSRDDAIVVRVLTLIVDKPAELKELRATDVNDRGRFSTDTLQMASKGGQRHATVVAVKKDPDGAWAEKEPQWSGIVYNNGAEVVQAGTASTDVQYAHVGDVTKKVTLEILDGLDKEISFSLDDKRKFARIVNKFSDYVGTGPEIQPAVVLSGKRRKVDRLHSNLCGNSASVSVSGSVGVGWILINGKPKWVRVIIPPQLKKYIDYEFGGKAIVSISIPNIEVYRDGRYEPPDWGGSFGGVSLTGELKGYAELKIKVPILKVTVDGELSGTARAFGEADIGEGVLSGSYTFGTIEASASIALTLLNGKTISGDITIVLFDGFEGAIAYDCRPYAQ